MKTLIKKEIRLLLPAWITAMLLAIVPRLFVVLCAPDYSVPLSFFANLIVAAGLLFLGINSFGQELSCNTFSALLSQPMQRPRIWRIKVATLAIAFISVWITAFLIPLWQFGVYQWDPWLHERPNPNFNGAVEFLTLSALVAFSGGLWTTLLLRQIAGAFWFTLLTPLAIILGISAVLQDWIAGGKSIEIFIVAGLLLYSVAGFVLAWRLFMRAQDVQWAGSEVSLPRGKRTSKISAGSLSFRPGHRFSALAWKEFQLHQGTYLIAAIVLVLHLTAWCIRKFHPPTLNPDLAFAFTGFWVLWLMMPLLIGATAIAEERRMGTLEPQFSFPVARGAQLFVKFCIALVLSLVLGALMPVLIEGTKMLDHWPWIFVVAAAIFFVSFYASSLGRTTLQGIGVAILFALFIYFYELDFSLDFERPRIAFIANQHLGIVLLAHYIGIPILLIAMAWLTISNIKHGNQNWKFWTRNIVTILAVFVCVPLLAREIYFRPWEVLCLSEPRGPVRITSPNQVKFVNNLDAVCAILPDGRLWAGPIFYDLPHDSVPNLSLTPDSCRGQFIGGSNWVAVAADEFGIVAVQSNGTLWAIPTDWSAAHAKTRPATMTQIGADDDWAHVASQDTGFLLLKKDGSLWTWGTRPRWAPEGTAPVRVSNETNWTAVVSEPPLVYARNKDGYYWLLDGYHMIQETNLDRQWLSLQFNDDLSYVEVKTNGTLWYFKSSLPETAIGNHEFEYLIPRSVLQARRFTPTSEQLGVSWKWKTAAFGAARGIQSIMAIRSDDGTFWQFPIIWRGTRIQPARYELEKPTQIGSRSDWIALAQGFALAGDGSIWVWDPRQSEYVWLAPSRRPTHMGNIFEEASN